MWGAARLFALADAAGLQCLISTTQEMSIGTAAVAHLGATVPVLDYPGDASVHFCMSTTSRRAPPLPWHATIIPDGTGIGVALDNGIGAARRCAGRVEGTPSPRPRVPRPLT